MSKNIDYDLIFSISKHTFVHRYWLDFLGHCRDRLISSLWRAFNDELFEFFPCVGIFT